MKLALSFMVMVSLASAASVPVEIIHNPVLTAPAGQAINVTAMLSGASSSLEVRLYYRVKGTNIYSSLVMSGSSSSVSGEIPAASVDTLGVEYYIQATSNSQAPVTSPSVNPSVSPYFITVRKDTSKPSLTILSPAEGETVETARPVITVAYENGDLGIDTTSVSVEIDGKKVKDAGEIQAFNTLMSYVPSDELGQGSHSVEVFVKNNSGTFGSIKWSFVVESMAGGGRKRVTAYKWEGHAGYETLYGMVLQQPMDPNTFLPYRPYGANRADVEVTGRGDTDTYKLKVYATDEDRSDQQATDRFTGLIQNDEGLIVLGDYSPTFSTLSMYQPLNVRGITVDLRDGDLADGHTRLMGVAGQTYRPEAAGPSAFTGGTQQGTYAQYLYGTRWELGNKYYLMGFNMVSVNDDANSLSGAQPGTTDPQFSGVATVDARIGIPQIYLKMSGETGADYDFNGPTLLGPNAGSGYVADLDWNVLPWGTHLTFDWKDLGGSFGFVPGGYTTMANPGLLADYRGYEAGFSQAALSNQFTLTLNANGWRDNLQNLTDRGVDENEFISGFVTIAPKGLPYLNVGYSLLTQNNNLSQAYVDANGTTVFAADTDTTNLSLGLGYGHALTTKMQLNLNVGMQQTMVVDQLGDGLRNAPDLTTVSYMLSGMLTSGTSVFSAAGSFGYSDTYGYGVAEAANSIPTPSSGGTNDSVSVGWMQPWIPGIFNTQLSYNLSVSDLNTGDVTGQGAVVNNSTRSTYSLGGDYTVAKAHHFALSVGYATVNITQSIGSFNSPDSVAMMLTDASYRWTF
jgi:hypothetical protein